MTRTRMPLLLCGVLLLPGAAHATSKLTTDELMNLSLEELSQVQVNTASVASRAWTEQPATMTVYDEEDIVNLGARDLQDVLRFIPGTSTGMDVFGVNSLIMRGNWAHEGKVLLLVDDMPVNDLLYGNLNLARHYPVSQIGRVEVLRGAGAAKYGGNAELAVIRVYSKEALRTGSSLTLAIEDMERAGLGAEATLSTTAVKGDWRLAVSAHLASVPYSGETWTDAEGTRVALGDLTGVRALNFLARMDWKDLRVRLFYDRHLSRSPQKFGTAQLGESVLFESLNLLLADDIRLAETWVLTPQVFHREQQDWFIRRDPAKTPVLNFFLPARKTILGAELKHHEGSLDLLAGVEYWKSKAWARSPGGPPGARSSDTYFYGRSSASHHATSSYVQGDWARGPWLVSVGARQSHHDYAGSSLVPRVSAAFLGELWQLKALVGQAFREPDLEVINASDWSAPAMQPERTTQKEIEFDLLPNKQWFLSLSLFEMSIGNPIIYSSRDNTDYYYINEKRCTTRGVELEMRAATGLGSLYFGASHYRAARLPPTPFRVLSDDGSYLGSPNWKTYLVHDFHQGKSPWHFQAAAEWSASFVAYADVSATQSGQAHGFLQREFPSRLTGSLMVRYEQEAWRVSLGLRNAFGTEVLYPQPYYSESSPYPGSGRTLWASFQWSFH